MNILNRAQLEKLIANGKAQRDADALNKKCRLEPPVLLRLPGNPPSAWLLASVDPEDHDIAFGLISLAGGDPELGYVRLSELESLRGYAGKSVYHDELFADAAPLDITEYADMAAITGQIVLQFNH